MKVFNASLEGAQHGGKSLRELAEFALQAGCATVQPSNFHLQNDDGTLMTAQKVHEQLDGLNIHLAGVSAHCPMWIVGTAHTGSKTMRPFLPANMHQESPERIESWARDYVLRLLDLVAELNLHVVPMFLGSSYGLEVASGYPWGFFAGPGYDLIKEGDDRLRKQYQGILRRANEYDISLAHEIHPGTGASCADDFLHVRSILDTDCQHALGVNADPSHCWAGEDWGTRFTKVGPYVTACHVKDFTTWYGRPRLSMESDWKQRGMQFCKLGEGQIDLARYAQLMFIVGYPQRYMMAHNTTTAPLVGEAESAFYDLDGVSQAACAFIRDKLCVEYATSSFEDGMGEQSKSEK